MKKFLSIPVTNEQYQLVPIDGILLVEQASTTTVTIQYQDAGLLTITHATAGAGDETERDAIQDAIVAACATDWTKPKYVLGADGNVSLPYAVSGIAVSWTAQPTA